MHDGRRQDGTCRFASKMGMEQDADFLREGVRVLTQQLMELEVSQQLGADKHERTPDRAGHRTVTGSGSGTPACAQSS